jgi:hypothetical protein
MSYSQRSTILSLLFKKGDPLCLDSYRPISLWNLDLKLISHVLAHRLKNVLPKIINVDQTGYVKNRFIGFNLRQIQDIIDYADIYKIEVAIIFVDFTKAFDSLEWNFMLNTLKHFGFNESFINWVNTLHTDIQTCVMNNGWVSEILRIQEEFVKNVLYQLWCLSCQWKSWLQDLETIKILRDFKYK